MVHKSIINTDVVFCGIKIQHLTIFFSVNNYFNLQIWSTGFNLYLFVIRQKELWHAHLLHTLTYTHVYSRILTSKEKEEEDFERHKAVSVGIHDDVFILMSLCWLSGFIHFAL
jgi:hypothetical protein